MSDGNARMRVDVIVWSEDGLSMASDVIDTNVSCVVRVVVRMHVDNGGDTGLALPLEPLSRLLLFVVRLVVPLAMRRGIRNIGYKEWLRWMTLLNAIYSLLIPMVKMMISVLRLLVMRLVSRSVSLMRIIER